MTRDLRRFTGSGGSQSVLLNLGVYFMMKRCGLLASVGLGALIASAGLAHAQDAFDWSGWYIGGSVGVGTLSKDSPTDDYIAYSYDESLLVGLLTAGINWQNGALVYGIEGDVGLSSHGNADGGFEGGYPFNPSSTYETSQSPFGTLRGRLGYAVGSLLLYGTAGLSVAHLDINDPNTDGSPNVRSGTVFAPVVGVGAEYAVSDQLSLKAELRYTGAVNLDSASYHNTVNSAIGLVGVNFHF